MYRPTANELRVLLAFREIGEAEPMRIGSRIGMGSSMTDYLCRYLTTHGLLQKSGRKTYKLSPSGQEALEDAFDRTLGILKQKESDVVETLAKIRLP
ncbi:MAG: hypothetical protein ACE5JO_12275 [Candidatus Binatia bacterium]